MHTDSTSRDGRGLEVLATAYARWEREPVLAAALRDEGATHLVLDAGSGRVLHASPAAARLADMLEGLDGRAIARQLAASCPAEGGPCLVRLRIDPRRIAPPAVFMVSRAADAEGHPVYLAVPSGTLSLPRTPPSRPARTRLEVAPPLPSPLNPPVVAEAPKPSPVSLREGDRFLWRSDEESRLTQVSGPLGGLAGRDWPTLSDIPESISAALASRRTFRRVPVSFRIDELTIKAELSGAPSGREGMGFRGFEGFGVIRSVGRTEIAPTAMDADLLAFSSDEDVAVETTLSTDEHAAFREIARALGARYAGDEEAVIGQAIGPRGAGSVTPFPGLRGDLATPASPALDEGTGDEAAGGLLEGLPMAALVHRGEAILAANRPFLDLTRFADIGSLRSMGIDAIFPGGPPNFRAGLSHEAAIGTANGAARPVEITRGICTWDGSPAAILLLRVLDESDPRRELAAERLARQVQAGRALGAEAALDALQAGVVTIDAQGRVVTLNRAAASYLAGSPTELVGSDFAGLFDAGSAGPLATALAGGEAPAAVLAQGRAMTLSLAPPRADGHRVAVLHRLPESTLGGTSSQGQAGPAAPRAPSLLRLDRELREPVDAILSLTRSMLEERFGALGDLRYRACLSDIRNAGERIVERMAELSDLAAIEAGQIDLHPRPLALNEVVAGCVAVLQTEAARGRIVLRTSFSADLAELEVDEASVRRAASLVIEHAIRRSVAGGQVIVSTGTGEAAEVALRVRDGSPAQEGAEPGAAEEDLRLALPRALVQANGGRLRLAGRGDEGMLVEILLPARCGVRA